MSKKRSTLETYQNLLEIEIKSLVQRIGEISQTVGQLFEAINEMAIKVEEDVSTMERVRGGVDFCRSEIAAINKLLSSKSLQIKQLEEKVASMRERLQALEAEVFAQALLEEEQARAKKNAPAG